MNVQNLACTLRGQINRFSSWREIADDTICDKLIVIAMAEEPL